MADEKTTKRTSQKVTTPESGTASFMAAGLEMQKWGLGPAQWLGTVWLESIGEFGSELTDFIAERIREDAKTQHEILNCRDPAILQDIQIRFIQRAIEQYTAETGRLVEMSQVLLGRMKAAQEN